LQTPIKTTLVAICQLIYQGKSWRGDRFLANSDFQPCRLWGLVKNEINYYKEGVLIVDDSVQDKRIFSFYRVG
jgi:hypothetical protein